MGELSLDTIKSSSDISNMFTTGKRLKTPYLTLIVVERSVGNENVGVKQHDLEGRVAFIAGKKLGNAVWRNSAKRRMRALCRDLGGAWMGFDVIFLAKSSLTSESYSKVLKACDKAIARSCLGGVRSAEERHA